MFAGQYETALTYAMIIKEEMDEKLIDMFFPYIEWYYSTYFHVYIRFGKWDEILSEEMIQCDKYPITKTIQRYARTISYAVKGNLEESEIEFNLFLKERENISKGSVIGNNPAHVVLQVGYHMALGEILYRKKDYEDAFDHLRESVKLCDQLKFSEPWDWMQPPRHALGGLLLEQEHIEKSITVYLKDLSVYPDNIWSLIGLEECYTKLILKLIEDKNNVEVENYENELKVVERKLYRAKDEAVMIIKASCYCKKII
jgi:tetratricopeptide (TPR) repeat protein